MYETTKASLDDYNVKLKTTMVDFKNINELIENLKGVFVKAETVYPGVRIKIGNSHYSVKSETSMAKIIKDHGEIILTTY